MGQTTSFDSALIKSNVLIWVAVNLMGSDIFMAKGGMFTFTEGMIRKTFSIRLEA
jgi:hypothetical protein